MANNQEELLRQYYELHPELAPKKPGLDPMFLENLLQNKGNPIPNPPMSVGSDAPFYSESDHPMSMSQSVLKPELPNEVAPPPVQQIPYSAPRPQAPIRQSSDEEALGGMISKPQDPSNNIMFGQNDLSTVENLKKAQQERDSNQNSARMIRGAALAGEGLLGLRTHRITGPDKDPNRSVNTGANKIADDLEKNANQPIQDLEQQTAMQKSDPNSAVSKGYRDMMKQFGVNVQGDASAADMEKIAPWIAKAYEGEQGRENQKELSKQRGLDRQALLKIKGDEKDSEISNKDALELDKHLDKGWASRGGQAGVIQNKINSAEAAEALIEQGKLQPGGLDSRQIEELSQSTARLLGAGGTTASARVEALVPHTLTGKAQTLKEFLTNEPQPQQMQAFTDRLAETIRREKELAQTQKRQYQVGGLAAHKRLKTKNFELYNQILQSKGIDSGMIDEKGMYKPANSEERRQTKDGKTAVFDSKTKAFLRYE